MIVYMIDSQGRARIAALVTTVIGRRGTSVAKVGAMPGAPSRETIFRVLRKEDVREPMLQALGAKLGLPMDFILYVGAGDVEKIRAAAMDDPDLVRWTVDLIKADRPNTRRRRRGVAG